MLSRPGAPAILQAGALLALALLISGCSAGQSPSEIRAETQRRGGGAEAFLVREAEAAVAAHLAADAGSLVLASVSVAPDNITLEVADPDTAGHWDRYRYADGKLGDPSPVRTGDDAPAGFRLANFQALDRLPELVADAMARTGFAEPSVTSIRIRPERRRSRDDTDVAGPRLSVRVNDPRRGAASQSYDARGRAL